MIEKLMEKAARGESVWLCDLKESFASAADSRRVILSLTAANGERHDFTLYVPQWSGEEQRGFVADYLHACVFNVLSVFGGRELRIFAEPGDRELTRLFAELDEAFQLTAETRRGLGKCISVSERIMRSFGGGHFAFSVHAAAEYEPRAAAPAPSGALGSMLRETAAKAGGLCLCGIDVGGTDIKLAAAVGNRIAAVKEYDWDPSQFTTAEELIAPIVLLLRLMRCAAAAEGRPELKALLAPALVRTASESEMRTAVTRCETELGKAIDVLDGIGVSFPDVVLRDRIVGGETPKTGGLRRSAAHGYEAEFAKLTGLRELLLPLCRPGGSVRMTNDGNMAAFTAAMELAHAGRDADAAGGVFAHTLGTDLGSGLLLADGSIPELPLELYDLLVELGSFPQRRFPADDLRSTRNENSGLCGARRYMGQAAVYRMAWELKPELLEGFVHEEGGKVNIISAPADLRKPCLEKLMELARGGDPEAREVFRRIGENLGKLSREAECLLKTGTTKRFLFGRFVKLPEVFALICEGCAGSFPELELIAADEDMAESPLMRSLAERGDVTVAQFGQAVGAAMFAVS